VLGYVTLVAITRVVNPAVPLEMASAFVSGMLAVFWTASGAVRERNADKYPNMRIALWGTVAVASLVVVLTHR
jgi:hypothetical protein